MGGFGIVNTIMIGSSNILGVALQAVTSLLERAVFDCRCDNGLQYQVLCDPGGTGSSAGLLWPPEDNCEF